MPVMSIMKFQILQSPVSEAGITAVIGKEKNILVLGHPHIHMMAKARQWNIANNALYIQIN